MLDDGQGRPGLLRPEQEHEEALERLIAAAAVVENLSYDLARQVPPDRVARILLLVHEMEQLVQDLQALLQGYAEKTRSPQRRG